jgi:serine/threonine-protein kinase
MVFLWTAAYAAFGEADYLTFAERAAISTFEAAERTASLCCGCAGQAYALLNLYRYTHESVWLHRGGELAKRAVECLSQTGELPNSLYKGGLGVAVLLVDIRDPAGARFPLFEDEGF